MFILRMFIELAILISVFCLLFRFKPRRSWTLYDTVIAHRGLHLFAPENTLSAYEAAKDSNLAIELDIRRTNDGEFVCFHDRYTKRLLGVPGKISMFDLDTIKKFTVLESEHTVPTLKEALNLIDRKVDILIEVKGLIDDSYVQDLLQIEKDYGDELFFHAKNIITYFKLRKVFKSTIEGEKKVYFILNIFRKRFNFVKGKDYSSQVAKYNELATNMDVEIPTIHDILSIIVRSIEELEDKKEILATIGSVMNNYESRVKTYGKEHWVYNSLWLHRAIATDKYAEHSIESFKECKKFAKANNISVTIEFDVMLYKGEVRCFHKDRISNILGQEKSCVDKVNIANSVKFKEILRLFKNCPNVNLAIDIKDYHITNRALEDLIILDIKNAKYTGNFIVMSYNPFVLSYFKQVEPTWLRAQIGHSLKGLRKVPIFRFPWILNGLLGMLFDLCCADCIVFDASKWIYYLVAYHKNIKGKPVLIYAPKTYIEQESFIGKDSVANFIIENIEDTSAWPKSYIDKFKK